jgi:hypothetical protein
MNPIVQFLTIGPVIARSQARETFAGFDFKLRKSGGPLQSGPRQTSQHPAGTAPMGQAAPSWAHVARLSC